MAKGSRRRRTELVKAEPVVNLDSEATLDNAADVHVASPSLSEEEHRLASRVLSPLASDEPTL
jgi:hypothetical protein